VLVDTGALYAMADLDDHWHGRVKACLERLRATLIVPVTVLPEACYLLSKFLGADAEMRLVGAVRTGEFSLEAVVLEDLPRCSELMDKYRDADIGFVDASVVTLAERLKIRRVMTTDRRHFSIIRPRHCPRFELLP
jgi:predicted nucleic acid-binding protein